MPRKPRVVAAAVPHHVTQRGNNRQDIFLVDDRRFYLAALAANSRRHGLRVMGYCLSRNQPRFLGKRRGKRGQRPISPAQFSFSQKPLFP